MPSFGAVRAIKGAGAGAEVGEGEDAGGRGEQRGEAKACPGEGEVEEGRGAAGDWSSSRWSERRGGGEEDKKMSMMESTGKITYGEYRFKETVWFSHAIKCLLSFYKVCKTLNLDKIIQDLLKMLYIVFL